MQNGTELRSELYPCSFELDSKNMQRTTLNVFRVVLFVSVSFNLMRFARPIRTCLALFHIKAKKFCKFIHKQLKKIEFLCKIYIDFVSL